MFKNRFRKWNKILMKLNNGSDLSAGVTYISGNKGYEDRDAYMELANLEQGDYALYVEMEWQKSTAEEDRSFCVTSYGCSNVTFEKDMQSEYSKEDILRSAFMAKAERAADFSDITVTDFSGENAPKAKKYSCSKSGEGYNWTLIVNDEADVTVREEVNYPKFEGLTLLAPHQGSSYTMEVRPGEKRLVMIRGDLAGYSLRMTYTSQLFWGEKSLLQQCLASGQQKVRGEGIIQYSMQHTGGIFFVYKNDSQDKTLKEEITFDIDALEVEGHEGNKVVLDLGPGQQEIIKLTATGGPWQFGCSCAYGVE